MSKGGGNQGGAGGGPRGGRERQVDERIGSYVDGCLAPRDLERFRAELRVNPQLKQDLEEYERTVAAIRAALQAPTVPSKVADRVLLAIGKPAPVARRAPQPRWQSMLWSFAAAAALLALAVWLNTWEGGPAALDTVSQAPAHQPADADSSKPDARGELLQFGFDRARAPAPPATTVPTGARSETTADDAAQASGEVPGTSIPEPKGNPEPKGGLAPAAAGGGAAPAPPPLSDAPAGVVGLFTLAVPPAAPAVIGAAKQSSELPAGIPGPGVTSPGNPAVGAPAAGEGREKAGEPGLQPQPGALAREVATPSGAGGVTADQPSGAALHQEVGDAAKAAAGVDVAGTTSGRGDQKGRDDQKNQVANRSGPAVAGPATGGPAGPARGTLGRGAPAGGTSRSAPIPVVVITAESAQLAAVSVSEALTGADDFYLGSTRKSGAGAASAEVPELAAFFQKQFPRPATGPAVANDAPLAEPTAGAGGEKGAEGEKSAKVAPRAAGAEREKAESLERLAVPPSAGMPPVPVFSRWRTLRFSALTPAPAEGLRDAEEPGTGRSSDPTTLAGGRGGEGGDPAPTAPVATGGERIWLVEGSRAEVADLLRRLATLARESGFHLGNGELPADAPLLQTRRPPEPEASGPAEGTPAAPVAPGGGAAQPTGDSRRIVVRFKTR